MKSAQIINSTTSVNLLLHIECGLELKDLRPRKDRSRFLIAFVRLAVIARPI